MRFAEYGANVAINYLRQPEEAADTEEQVHACVAQGRSRGRPRRARRRRRLRRGRRRAHGRRGDRAARRPRHPRQQRRHPDLAPERRALQRATSTGARRQPARLVPVRARGDPPLPRRGEARARSSTSRASTSSSPSRTTSATRRARAACRTSRARSRSSTRRAASASTASAPARPSRRSTAPGSTTRSSARRSRSTSRCAAPATPTRWPASRASSPATTPPTSPGQTIFVDGGLTLFPSFRDAVVLGVTLRDDSRWWPSPFGADDQLGMLNHVDDAKRREALALVREGRLYDLGRVLDEPVPVFPGRYFRQTLVTTAHHANRRRRRATTASTGSPSRSPATKQLGTHLDALSHLQIGDRGYNGWTRRRARRHGGRQAPRRRDGPADRHARLARRRPPAVGPAAT